jgi:hypothetical protein
MLEDILRFSNDGPVCLEKTVIDFTDDTTDDAALLGETAIMSDVASSNSGSTDDIRFVSLFKDGAVVEADIMDGTLVDLAFTDGNRSFFFCSFFVPSV